jgi:hypothetical protein
MEVSDEMWKWAEEQCSNQEGPASFLLNILIGAMRRMNSAEKRQERLDRLRQMQSTMWEVCDLIDKRRPDLYPADDDISGIMGAIDRAWKPGMTAEEVFAAVVPNLSPPSH